MSGHQFGMQFDELVVDLFAGGGGASTGIEMAIGRPPDIAINHAGEALAAHCANHPNTVHFQEDVFGRCPSLVTGGRSVGLLWMSPTCTHFSKAKGAKLLDKKIRALAWVGVRWAIKVQPRIIMLENVEEFKDYGPLDLDGKPIPEKKGSLFRHFVRRLEAAGYTVEYDILHAHHYGAPTSRKRLFMVARRDNLPIVWPDKTHGPDLHPYRTAGECIDWSIPCPSIFTRKKPLVEATLRRIARGIQKFIVDVDHPFIAPVGTSFIDRQFGTGVAHSLDEPLGTIMANGGGGKSALVSAFLEKHYTGVTGHGVERSTGTITTADHHSLVACNLISIDNRSNTGTCAYDAEEPLKTIVTENRFALVQSFMMKYYGTNVGHSLGDPLQTITTRDRFALVTVSGELYKIADIGMRMLQPRELFTAQGFESDYVIDPSYKGKPLTKTVQTRLVGNSVSPPCAALLVAANFTPQSCQLAA